MNANVPVRALLHVFAVEGVDGGTVIEGAAMAIQHVLPGVEQ